MYLEQEGRLNLLEGILYARGEYTNLDIYIFTRLPTPPQIYTSYTRNSKGTHERRVPEPAIRPLANSMAIAPHLPWPHLSKDGVDSYTLRHLGLLSVWESLVRSKHRIGRSLLSWPLSIYVLGG